MLESTTFLTHLLAPLWGPVFTSRHVVYDGPYPVPTSSHMHTVHLLATHSNRYWHVLFLPLPRCAAGRRYWKSGAAHTLDIYKTTNHWNHRNVLFHFYWQTSCHKDHTAATQPSEPQCTAFSFPSHSISLSFVIHFCLWLSHLYLPFSLSLHRDSVLHESQVFGRLTHRCLRPVQVLLELQWNVLRDVCSEAE